MADVLFCPACGKGFSEAVVLGGNAFVCEGCSVLTRATAFHALWRPQTRDDAQPVVEEGEAACFNHPEKRAVLACESCGRYICALCDVDLGSRHTCPLCIGGKASVDLKQALHERFKVRQFRWDMCALGTALLSSLLFFLVVHLVISAPAVLYMVVRYWRDGRRVTRDGRGRVAFYARMVMAGLAAIGQLLWLMFIFVAMFR